LLTDAAVRGPARCSACPPTPRRSGNNVWKQVYGAMRDLRAAFA
jgi:hypothetical protein